MRGVRRGSRTRRRVIGLEMQSCRQQEAGGCDVAGCGQLSCCHTRTHTLTHSHALSLSLSLGDTRPSRLGSAVAFFFHLGAVLEKNIPTASPHWHRGSVERIHSAMLRLHIVGALSARWQAQQIHVGFGICASQNADPRSSIAQKDCIFTTPSKSYPKKEAH